MAYGRIINTFAKNPVRSLAAGTAANAAYRAAGYYLNQNKKDAMPKTAAKMGMKRRSRMRSRRKSSGNNTFVTRQKDTVSQYRYRRMPRYKRKRWVKKVKANVAMDYALAGTRTVVYNGSVAQPIRAGKTQGFVGVHLYGMNGDGGTVNGLQWEIGQSDINYLISQDPKIITTGQQLSKFRFTSALVDLTFRNSSTNNLTLEVDLYTITYTDETDFTSLYRLHNAAVTRIADSTGALLSTNLSLEGRGVTPFDITALAQYGVKVLSKRKFFLPNGDTFTYQHRDPRNHYFSGNDLYDNQGYVMKRKTVSLIAVFKPVVGGTVADANLTMGATRVYRYGIIGANDQAGNWLI